MLTISNLPTMINNGRSQEPIIGLLTFSCVIIFILGCCEKLYYYVNVYVERFALNASTRFRSQKTLVRLCHITWSRSAAGAGSSEKKNHPTLIHMRAVNHPAQKRSYFVFLRTCYFQSETESCFQRPRPHSSGAI